MSIQIQLRRDTAANWTSVNPTLAQGEIGFETDTIKLKIGDGTTAWNSLTYFGGGGATAFTDLTDVPNSYTGCGGCIVAVNGGETGLEFVNGSGLYLLLDQTTPQTVANGIPYFSSGLRGPLYDNAGTPVLSIDPNNRILYGSDGTTSVIDYSGTYNPFAVFSWENLQPLSSFGYFPNSIDVYQILGGGYGNSSLSIDPNNRILYASDGTTPVLDWDSGSALIGTVTDDGSGAILQVNGLSSISYSRGTPENYGFVLTDVSGVQADLAIGITGSNYRMYVSQSSNIGGDGRPTSYLSGYSVIDDCYNNFMFIGSSIQFMTSADDYAAGLIGLQFSSDAVADFLQVSTPVNYPASGRNKLYFKADDHLYMMDYAGTETQVDGGGGMVYPGAGIALSTGSAWDTSITDNSSNWNTAYSWGDHSLAGYLTDAPSDNKIYGRCDGGWYEVVGGGNHAFTDLTDVPNSYSGCGGLFVKVNAGETGLEFVAGGGGSPAGANYNIQFYCDGNFGADVLFNWLNSGIELGCYSAPYCTCVTRLDYNTDGHQLAFIGTDCNEKGWFGWLDAEFPYLIWSNCCTNVFACMDADNIGLYTDCDSAYVCVNDTDNSVTAVFLCGFSITGGGGSWGICWDGTCPNNVKINNAYYLPSSAPSNDGDVIKYDQASGVAIWAPDQGGGTGTSSGCQYSIQLSDGNSGFIDAGTENGYNIFQYDYCSRTLCMIGWDVSGVSTNFEIYPDNCNSTWRFFSGDTCTDTCGGNVRFSIASSDCRTFQFDDNCSNCFVVDPWNDNVFVYEPVRCINHYFGYKECGTGIWEVCGAGFVANWCACDAIRGYLNTYDDWYHFEDYRTLYSGTACDLGFCINNGCTNGYTVLNFTGLQCGSVVNSACNDLILTHQFCDGIRIGTSGFVTMCGTTDFRNGICVSGNAGCDVTLPVYNDGSTSGQLCELTFTCGVLTGYQVLP